MESARRWLSEHRELSIILGATVGMVGVPLFFRDGSGALVALAVGVLFLALYLGVNRLLDWWESR